MNNKIDWLIITDQDVSRYCHYCKNVTFIKSSLNYVKNKIEKMTSLKNINLYKPYKLCDYRPLYGIIFSEYLSGYDYWGYSDLDVVYGDLFKFISYGLKNNSEKIGHCGHFTLIRNDYKMNYLYKLPVIYKGHKINLFKDIISKTSKACHFDEYGGINIICKQYHIPTYNNRDLVNDISFENLDLCTRDKRFVSNHSCFIWYKGHAEYFYIRHHKIYKHEYGYFHFQKRHAFVNYLDASNIFHRMFSITTYGYNKMDKLTSNVILHFMKMNKSSFIKRFIYLLKWYVFSKNIFHMHFGNVFKRIFIDHNFSI